MLQVVVVVDLRDSDGTFSVVMLCPCMVLVVMLGFAVCGVVVISGATTILQI